MIPDGKQAGANLAVGRNPYAAAMPAERVRHRSDDSDLADPVVTAITSRRLTALMRNFDQRWIFIHPIYDLFQRHNCIWSPHAIFFKRHEFDEAHNDAFFASEHTKRNDLIFIEAAH